MLLKTKTSNMPPSFLLSTPSSVERINTWWHIFLSPRQSVWSHTLDRRQFSDPLTHLQRTWRRTLSSFSPTLLSASSASLHPTPPFSTSNPRNAFNHTSVSKNAEADISAAGTIARCHQCEVEPECQQTFSKPICCLLEKGIMPFYLHGRIERMPRPKFASVLESYRSLM